MQKRNGFTLLELIISLSIVIIVIIMALATFSRFYTVRAFYEQQLVIEQNFRLALDRITEDFRESSNPEGGAIILKPEDNTMEEELIFSKSGGTQVRYILKGTGSQKFAIYREISNDFTATPPSLISSQPITEDMNQIVKLYFIRQGGKVVVIIVGKTSYFGAKNIVSFTSLIYSRNSPEENP
ncbi:MAG: prepilin-type N-terminal cleavage/methylation domain-containing protein [Caldisericaceae bacterium]